MSLQDRLLNDMKEALRARGAGKTRLNVIRMVRSALKNAEIDKGRQLSDEEVLEVIAREVKQKRETIDAFAQAGRRERVRELEEELRVLEAYLPQQLTQDEIRELVSQVVEELGAAGPGDLGKVMGRVMPMVRGRADGSAVSRVARELLQS